MKLQGLGLVLGLMGLMLAGCSGDLDFTIRFKAVDGLRTGDRVWADAQTIGSVSAVDYSDQADYLVAVRIERAYAETLGQESIFYVDADPQQPERKALMVIVDTSHGDPITDGETVAGTAKWKALMERMTRRMEDTVSGLAAELDQYWQDLQNLSASEQVQRLEQELDRILAELKRLGASARQELQTHILPRLREQLDALRRKLEAPEHEEQFDRLEEKIERIDREISA